MTEDNNALGRFGARSAKFDELLKKYETIDEGGTVSAPAYSETQSEGVPETAETQTRQQETDTQAEAASETQAEGDVQTQQEAEGFSFDEQKVNADDSQTQPDYSYDLDMFGSFDTKRAATVESFNDSWLDSALDDSIFYKPESTLPSTATQTEAAVCDTEEGAADGYDPEQAQLEADKEKYMMGGGYIAPSGLTDFQFDPESGMDFGTCEEEENVPAEKSAKAKKKKKNAREKKDSGKNETTAVTDFSKNYKASEGKGSKKDNFFVRNFVPKKSDTAFEKLRKIIMIICVAAFLCSAGYLFADYVIQPIVISGQMNKLEEMVGEGNVIADKTTLAEKYPGVKFPDGMLEKYADLYARNPDLVGWINIDGLDISLPVVKGEDNKEYLKRDFDGKYSKYGSVFMNCANDADILNYNTSLFGHHMLDSKMFGNLVQYKDAATYQKAPVIEFNTIYGDYKWKIFAVFITNGTEEGDDGYLFNYLFTDLSTPEKVEKFLGEIDQRAIYKPEVDIAVSDKILTLSTCTYEFDEARLVVMARMVRPGESVEVSGKVITNDNPRYPAAYYKANGLTNPYASAYRWQPS